MIIKLSSNRKFTKWTYLLSANEASIDNESSAALFINSHLLSSDNGFNKPYSKGSRLLTLEELLEDEFMRMLDHDE